MLRLFRLLLAILATLIATGDTFAEFSLTSTSTYYQVDTGAGLVFRVRRTDNGSSTQSAGDIMSLVWNGVQYQNQSRGSQITSGFDWLYTGVSAVNVSATTVGTDYIKITVQAGNLTHYYMARRAYPHIYMGTYFTTQPDIHGLVRYIFRIPQNLLPDGPEASDIRQTTSTIESGDIFALPNGETRSKHYSNMRLKDWSHIGATGPGVGVWVLRDNHEGGSGGPFYRSLLMQTGSDQEITYIVNYGQAQTEPYRTHILNHYTTVFTQGGPPPAAVDTSWFDQMDLLGYLPPSGRGTVAGSSITGRDTAFEYTVGLSNSAAQFWTDVDPVTGAFTCANVRPGDYTLTVYKNELAVSTAPVSVAAGVITQIAPIAITADPARTLPLWRVGAWDGTPLELSNGPLATLMHPSDPRLAPWAPGPFVVGQSNAATAFPCYHWGAINGGQVIQFQLTAGQLLASTVRVGITVAYANARPRVGVNSWTSSIPFISTQPNSRTLTTGSYRGNNTTYTFSVPASALVVGTNTLTIWPVSGSGSGGYLSAGYSIDAVDFAQTTLTRDVLPAPTAFSVTAARPAAVRRADLAWSPVARATGYRITRATSPSGPFVMLSADHPTTSYSDSAVGSGSVFYYRLAANSHAGSGALATAEIDFDSPPLSSASLTWTGAVSAAWDTATTLNWINPTAASAADVFLPGDTVRFDDSSAITSLTLAGDVEPAAVIVDTAATYTFSGPGALTGSGTLTKTGSGTLLLSSHHTHTGSTTVNAGSLLVTGSFGGTAVSVGPGASLGGTGTLGGDLSVASGGTLLLGVSPSATRGVTVAGASTLTGNITVSPRLLGATLEPGAYPFLTYTGALGGTPSFIWVDPTSSGLHATFDTASPGQLRVVLRSPLQAWRAENFGTDSPSVDNEDADDDGIPNLLEYALGGDPLSANTAVRPLLRVSDSDPLQATLAFSFLRARADLTYKVESSPDLESWTVVVTNPGVVGQFAEIAISSDTPRRFVRLSVNP